MDALRMDDRILETNFRGGKILTEPYGYPVSNGYLGWVKDEHTMRLFATEEEYYEYIGR